MSSSNCGRSRRRIRRTSVFAPVKMTPSSPPVHGSLTMAMGTVPCSTVTLPGCSNDSEMVSDGSNPKHSPRICFPPFDEKDTSSVVGSSKKDVSGSYTEHRGTTRTGGPPTTNGTRSFGMVTSVGSSRLSTITVTATRNCIPSSVTHSTVRLPRSGLRLSLPKHMARSRFPASFAVVPKASSNTKDRAVCEASTTRATFVRDTTLCTRPSRRSYSGRSLRASDGSTLPMMLTLALTSAMTWLSGSPNDAPRSSGFHPLRSWYTKEVALSWNRGGRAVTETRVRVSRAILRPGTTSIACIAIWKCRVPTFNRTSLFS
eukprot:PhM_4_TR8366/c0_g1_i1/m.14609